MVINGGAVNSTEVAKNLSLGFSSVFLELLQIDRGTSSIAATLTICRLGFCGDFLPIRLVDISSD
jgi:hypothetical protein